MFLFSSIKIGFKHFDKRGLRMEPSLMFVFPFEKSVAKTITMQRNQNIINVKRKIEKEKWENKIRLNLLKLRTEATPYGVICAMM